MRLDHQQPGYTDKAKNDILELGGKLGGLRYLEKFDSQIGKLILPMVTIAPGERWQGNLPAHNGKLIVRGSHENDFQGLVDVLKSEVVRPDEVRRTIEKIRAQAISEEVTGYGRSENPDYDGKNIVVGIQPFGGNFRGSVVEHPNRPGQYVISTVLADLLSLTRKQDITATTIYHSSTDYLEMIRGYEDDLKCAKSVVDVYRRIRASDLVREDLSFQMEFLEGREVIGAVCQVRAFVPFEKPKKFEVPNGKPRLAFGVTPEEGIELPVYQSPDGLDSNNEPIDPSDAWALLRTCHNQTTPFSFHPRNLWAYLIAQTFHSGLTPSLEHSHFRLAQKAGVTVFENFWQHHDDFDPLLLPKYGRTAHIQMLKSLCLNPCFMGEVPKVLKGTAGFLDTKVRIVCNGVMASVVAMEL